MASINEKLNYINETKSLIKDKLNNLGSEIDNETTFREYTEKIENLYEEWPKVNDEDVIITLNNTKKGKMNLQLKGNTSQNGTPTPTTPQDIHVVSGDNSINICGKNIFQMPTSATKNGITYTLNDNGTFNISGTATAQTDFVNSVNIEEANIVNGETYTLYFNELMNFYGMVAFYNGVTWLSTPLTISSNAQINSATLTIPNNCNKINFLFRVGNGVTVNQNNAYCMLVKGSYTSSNLPTFEPYQGNTYPVNLPEGIELCKIGNYQDVIKKSAGKNLFDKSTIIEGKYIDSSGNLVNDSGNFVGDYIKIDNTKSYYVYANTDGAKRIAYYDSTQTFISRELITSSGGSLTIPNNASYVRLSCYNADLDSLQLEKGTSHTPYEPYGTGWYLKKEIGKVVLDGSENYTFEVSENFNQNRSRYTIYQIPTDYSSAISHIAVLSNLASDSPDATQYPIYDNTLLMRYVAGQQTRFDLMSSTLGQTTVAGFKSWLGSNNLIVYYVLATPTYTEITDSTLISQLNALAKSYASQTNISQESNNLSFIINATALMKNSD